MTHGTKAGSWLAVAGAALLLSAACGSEDEPKDDGCGSQSCPYDYSKFDGQTPVVSFSADVLPILRQGCGLSSVCHGDPAKAKADLYLGPKLSAPDPTAAERQAIVDGIVGVASQTAPSLSVVAAGDPENSFLMLKMDGCHNVPGLVCTPQPGAETNGACGDPMPQTGDLRCKADRDTVRRWIAQGAKAD